MSRRRDRRRMAEAIRWAETGLRRTGDNPSVGCVVCDRDGHVIAAARTGDGGRPHAEEAALADVGAAAEGGTAYVTLEPCRERSTGAPACSERLVAAGLDRVVIALRDLHPLGAGGLARLARSGVRIQIGLKAQAAAPLYRDFFARAAAEAAGR
ncbi:MAG: riboflavin biosynthesis protein RibD [Pseudomonadota bacterium]